MNEQSDETTAIPADVLADFEEVSRLAAAGKRPGAQLERRIRERSARVQKEILATHGVVQIGADIIREMRHAE